MGYGDAIMASALARGMAAQGKLVAFFAPIEDHRTIKWTGYCEDIFRNNPNIARPGMERQENIVWYPHYKKVFPYCRFDGVQRRWVWDMSFRAQPGEFFFTEEELLPRLDKPFLVIEPNIAWQRQVNVNKDWGEGKFEALGAKLIADGHTVVQFIHPNSRRRIAGALQIETPQFHQAAAIMSRARLIIAPEGANHHAAAALGVPSVIVWGGFSPPATMGYENQIKLTGGATACGKVDNCPHCRAAMNAITVEEVYQAARSML